MPSQQVGLDQLGADRMSGTGCTDRRYGALERLLRRASHRTSTGDKGPSVLGGRKLKPDFAKSAFRHNHLLCFAAQKGFRVYFRESKSDYTLSAATGFESTPRQHVKVI